MLVIGRIFFSCFKFIFLYAPFVNVFYVYYTHYLLRFFKRYNDLYRLVLIFYVEKVSLVWLNPDHFDQDKMQNWYTFYLLPEKIDTAIQQFSFRKCTLSQNFSFLLNILLQIFIWVFIRFYIRADFKLFELVVKFYTQFFIWVFDSIPMPLFLKNTSSRLPFYLIVQVIISTVVKLVLTTYKIYKTAPTLLLFISYLNVRLIKQAVERTVELNYYLVIVAAKLFERLDLSPFYDYPQFYKLVTGEYNNNLNATSIRFNHFKSMFWSEYIELDLAKNFFLPIDKKLRLVRELSIMDFLILHNNLNFETAKRSMLFLNLYQCVIVACNSNFITSLFKPFVIKMLLTIEKFYN
jgi:hypothetical protein